MGTLERRERERTELRQRILDAARDLFAKHGYEAVSMRKIAEAIEYSPTALYVHFRDKAALFHELCGQDFLAFAGVFQKLAAVADPVERLTRIGEAYIAFALKHPNHYRLMFMTRAEPAAVAPTEDDLKDKGNPTVDAYAFLKQAVTQAIAAGRLRPELREPDLVAQTLWASVHGVASLQITFENDPWIEWQPLPERARLMLDAVIRGLVSMPGPTEGGAG